MLDENNVIEDENNNDVTPESNEDEEDERDELLAAAEARAEKYESRFKKTAKELNDLKKSQSSKQEAWDVSEQVSKQVQEEMYYATNPTAKEFKAEIKEIQTKTWMTPEDALTFYIAKNKPELIGKQSSLWVDWVSKSIEPEKKVSEMTYEELRPTKK